MINPTSAIDVFTVTRAADNLPQTATTSYFTISADDTSIPAIELIAVLGFAETAIQAGANAAKLSHSMQGDLCATLDIGGDAQFTSYSITGVLADPRVDTSPTLTMERTAVLFDGDIQFTCAASSTGTTSWTVLYKKLQPSVTVEEV